MEQMKPPERPAALSAGARYRQRLARYPERNAETRLERLARALLRAARLPFPKRRRT